jgi:uncharacterized protein (TIGR03086 family)
MFDRQGELMTPNLKTQNNDPRPFHRQALAQTEALVAAVTPGQLTLPTPCTEFDVRALLGHLIGALTRHAVVGEGGDGMAVNPHVSGIPDDGWLDAYHAARTRVAAAWADDAKLDALVEVPFGKVPGRVAVSSYVQEVLVHGWDLAKATGQPTELDPEPAAWVLAFSQQILPPERRGGEIPFDPPVPVPSDAGPYTQLAAWLGRQP